MHTGASLEKRDERLIGLMVPRLNENDRSFFLAAMSEYHGYGSSKEISELTGISQHTISVTKKELRDAPCDPKFRKKASGDERIRAPGGGRKGIAVSQPGLVEALEDLMEPHTAGNPMSFIRWSTRSTRNLQEDLEGMGFKVSHKTIAKLLSEIGYSLQQNKKYLKVSEPGPDRDEQFRFIDSEARRFADMNAPIISVDAKKKEIIGNFKNQGSEWRPVNDPRLVNDHDFEGDLGKVVPYGIYDITNDEGFVNVGIGSDTAEFAVNSISDWWFTSGRYAYPEAREIMITCDGGGSNGSRVRLWKAELQKLANLSGMTFTVRHFPPGTSKWNKIEHRLFSYISMNWKAIPLVSYELVVDLISSTKTSTGKRITCRLDEWPYETGRDVPEYEMEMINITKCEWRGDWNYTIAPYADKN